MDPHSFIARAEAQRWLGIAEKLLMGHDLVGSKTFAIRARDSDPRLEAADQILAITDTLLAAEKRVVANNGTQQPDFYAILQLVRFVQDAEHIASQYRRLAVMLNPHQNRFPYSDQAFQLVNDAWAVLSNPMRKSMYDAELDFPPQQQQQMNPIGFNLEQHHHQQQHHHHQQQQHNFFSINHMGSGHEQELSEPPQTFQTRVQQSHQQQQLQQHNFLSQPNPVRPLPVREQEQLFQHREQEQMFQPQVQPFQVTSVPQQQTRPTPQPPQPQPSIQSPSPPPPAAPPQPPFSWPQTPPLAQQQQQLSMSQPQPQPQSRSQPQQQHLQPQPQQPQQQLPQKQRQQQPQPQQQLPKQPSHQPQQQLPQKQEVSSFQQPQQQPKPQPQPQPQQQLPQKRQQPQPQQQLPQKQSQQQPQPQPQPQQQLPQKQNQQPHQQLPQKQNQQQPQQQLQPEVPSFFQQPQQQPQPPQQQPQKQSQQQPQQPQQQQQQQLPQKRQQEQQQQQKQGQQQHKQESLEHNDSPVQLPSQINSNNGVREEEIERETEAAAENVDDDSPTFWTACPYCFYMYEYPKVYAECTLRCDNCKRAFEAVRVPSPPPIIEGQEACFYCWGFFPLGVSMSHLEKNNGKGASSNWTPFSPLYDASSNVQDHLNGRAAPKENIFVHKSSGPRIYIDDVIDDVFMGISEPSNEPSDEPSDDSDAEWDSTREKKMKRMKKGLEPGYEKREQVLAVRARDASNGSVKNPQHTIPVEDGVGVPVPVTESSKKVVGGNPPRRQSGRIAKELGKLDLNVEFNHNEGEEPAPRMTAGNRGHGQGEEDNIEGIGFFEGLDEFLSSLPILSVVNDEKVKAA